MKLPPAPPKPAASRDMAKLELSLRYRVESIVDEARKQGLRVVVSETIRSEELALWYWKSGREFDGPILTKLNPLKGQRSRHCPNKNGLSEGADIMVLDKSGVAKSGDVGWKVLGMLANKHGLTWGGDWPRFKDMPHVELPLGGGLT